MADKNSGEASGEFDSFADGIGAFLRTARRTWAALPGVLLGSLLGLIGYDPLTVAGMTAIGFIAGVFGAYGVFEGTQDISGPFRSRATLPGLNGKAETNALFAVVSLVAFLALAAARSPLAVMAIGVYTWFLYRAFAYVATRRRVRSESLKPLDPSVSDPETSAYAEKLLASANRHRGDPTAAFADQVEAREIQHERLWRFLEPILRFIADQSGELVRPVPSRASGLELAMLRGTYVVVPVPSGIDFDGAVAVVTCIKNATLGRTVYPIGLIPDDLSLEARGVFERVWAHCNDGTTVLEPALLWSTEETSAFYAGLGITRDPVGDTAAP
jgi:hypothetical protein